MRIISELGEMTETARGWLAGGSVGLVPTKGNLHSGNLSLVKAARSECQISVVSILNTSLQWHQKRSETSELLSASDLPPDLAWDLQLLNNENVDVVFVPRHEAFYPSGFSTFVELCGPVAERLEGALLPAYFRAVATEITKLIQLVRPDVAFFGQKDAQQVTVIRQLVHDLNIDIRLSVLPTVREYDGLAMSHRNASLSPVERQSAIVLYQALQAAKSLIQKGVRKPAIIEKAMADRVAKEPLVKLDYAAVCDAETFQEVERLAPGTLLLVAAHIGTIHLIDNIIWLKDGHWLT